MTSLTELPGISSQMERQEFVEAVAARLRLQEAPPDLSRPHVYGLSVMKPRPYHFEDEELASHLEPSGIEHGFVGYEALYGLPQKLVEPVLRELADTSEVIQVRFSDREGSEPNRVNVELT